MFCSARLGGRSPILSRTFGQRSASKALLYGLEATQYLSRGFRMLRGRSRANLFPSVNISRQRGCGCQSRRPHLNAHPTQHLAG